MSSVVISGDTSGAITLSAPAVSGTNTATLPAATGTVMVSGNMPAFSAYYAGAGQSISANTWTKITFNTEEYDTNNNFASNRFTPTVAGYYQVNTGFRMSNNATQSVLSVWKNGAEYKRCTDLGVNNIQTLFGASLVYCNGSTDYIEIYVYIGSSQTGDNGSNTVWYNGSMVRGA